MPPTDAVVLDSPLTGEWFVSNGGRSVLLNGHSPNESNAVDFLRLGANGRTHTGGSDAPLADYAGFGLPVLAPADGRIVEVTDGYADNPPGTNGDHANHLVMDIGGGRYVAMAHLKQGSVTVQRGRRRATWTAARRGREQRSLERAAPAPAGPGLPGRLGRRPHLPHGVPQRPHHQGRCLAVGRQPRASHRRPRPGTRAGDHDNAASTGPRPGWQRAASVLSAAIAAPPLSDRVQRLPAPTRPPAPATSTGSSGETAAPAVPGCRLADAGRSSAARASRRRPGPTSVQPWGPTSGPAPGTTPAWATPPARR